MEARDDSDPLKICAWGLGHAGPSDGSKAPQIEAARKRAINDAMRNAFCEVIVLVFPTQPGKAHAGHAGGSRGPKSEAIIAGRGKRLQVLHLDELSEYVDV